MNSLAVAVGATRYEFAMQLRRRALWIGFGLLSILLLAAFNSLVNQLGVRITPHGPAYSRHDIVLMWSTTCTFILTAGAGLLLADRTPRDRRTRTIELLQTAPAPAWSRLVGKYMGSVAATLGPILLVYLAGIGILMARWQDINILPVALAAFAALTVPPVFFVGAVSIACTTVLWPPLYQFLFLGYWAWASLNPGEAIPTISGTLLSPTEGYTLTGFFHFATYYPQDKGFYPDSSVALGIANIAVLLGCGLVALIAALRFQRWQADRQ